MKKFIKIFLLVLLFIIIVFVCFRIKDYIILSKISKVTDSLNSSFEPYFIKETEILPNGRTYIEENYRTENVLASRRTELIDKKIVSISTTWASPNEDFCNHYIVDSTIQEDGTETKSLLCLIDNKERLKEDFEFDYFINYYGFTLSKLEIEFAETWLNIRNKIEEILFYPSVSSGEYKGKECYIINPYIYGGYMRYYVDKETLLTIAIENWSDKDDVHDFREYEYLAEAPEGIYEKPNPKDFEKVIFYDSNIVNYDEPKKIVAENPVSGTNLKPGEMLVENVELKNTDDINFLKLTSNESGIINFEIYNLETYNMFRKKYPELRELNEEDFEFYYVAIAYKLGEKLNYLEHYESKEAWKYNFVVNGEKTNNKESLLLAVIPRENRNLQAIFVENNEKLKVSAEEAINNSSEKLEEIENEFGIEFESYIGYLEDHLDLLTKDEFAKLEYIQTPIKGEEKICWNLHYRVYKHETINYIEIYIDAATGDLIGAKKFYK